MNRNAGILILAIILATVLLSGLGSAQTVVLEGKNAVVKHTFYNSANHSAGFRFAEQETMVFTTKNNNVTIELIDWGREDCKNSILLRVSYQNQSNIVPLERGWRTQVAELQLEKNVHLTVGLTELFLGSPTKFASISTSLWMLE